MVARLPLSRGLFSLVDDDDLATAVAAGSWSAHDCGGGSKIYARRTVRDSSGQRTISLHTLLTGWPMVDHVNGDGLDNRRSNLRPASPRQNNANLRLARNNTSGFKGVSFHKQTGRFRAALNTNGKCIHLGLFSTAEEAAHAYDVAAIQLWGEFARPNFPPPATPGFSPSDSGSVLVALLLALSIVGGLLGLLLLGQTAMCGVHDDQILYCDGYSTVTTQETP
jgi:hypothetical protein